MSTDQSSSRALLVILDGWGHGQDPEVSAIARANTPFIDSLYKDWPNAELRTDGEFVGLPEGQMGNSEVGHLNIGAGRIVYQELLRIHRAVEDGSFAANSVLRDAMLKAKMDGRTVHLMGLVSDGGVHSHINHLKALSSLATELGISDLAIHAFMDGRDTDPEGGVPYLKDLEAHLENNAGTIASVVGRYYAMDRDRRWPRIKKAYDLLTKGTGSKTENAVEALQASYDSGVTDEFIEPICVERNGAPVGLIKPGDTVICFNFRTDRCRQITTALTQQDMPDEGMSTMDLHYVTMTRYDESFEGVHVVFEKDDLKDTLGEVLSREGKTQIRIAETEKYPHVTFFFSGGREEAFEGEERLIVASPKVATYDLQPEMSAPEVRDSIAPRLRNADVDFVCLNFANADMVGHTGDMQAAITACETVDSCARSVVEAAIEGGYNILVTADNGNADKMKNPDGSANTAHTTNPVPVFLYTPSGNHKIRNGKLGDLAPTILGLMELSQPEAMTGEILVEAK